MKMKMKMKALLILVLLLPALSIRGGSSDTDNLVELELQPNEAKTVQLTLDLDATSGPQYYTSFMNEVQRRLAATTTKPHIKKRPVLGVQKYWPDVWIHVDLKSNGDSTTLAIRADNVYLVGFKAQAGWYAFKGKDSLIKGSTPLDFADDYHALTGGGYHDLAAVVVGKKSAQEALSILAKYKKASTAEKEVKMALTRFVLMICEAARLTPIRQDVIAAWEKGGTVREVGVDITVKWRVISCALIVWEKTKKWNHEDATAIKELGDPKMVNAESAAKNIYCIIQPTPAHPCSDEKKA